MELIGTDTDYAMRALVHLTLSRKQGPVPTKTLAGAQGIPVDFAYKILEKLTRAGLTSRYRGARGGFALARSPAQINLLEVIQAIQGPVAVRKCCLGLDNCPRSSSCVVQPRLERLQASLMKSLRDITLADVLGSKYPAPGPTVADSRRSERHTAETGGGDNRQK